MSSNNPFKRWDIIKVYQLSIMLFHFSTNMLIKESTADLHPELFENCKISKKEFL